MQLRSFVSFLLIVLGAVLPVAAADYVWDVRSEDPDNIFTNGVHFRYGGEEIDPAKIPTTSILYVRDESKALTVRLPKDCRYSSSVAPAFRAYANKPFTLDMAEGSTWTQTNLTGSANYTSNGRLQFQFGGNSIFQHYYSDCKYGAFLMSNALATVTYNDTHSTGNALDFKRGLFDFYTPNGTSLSYAYLYLGAGAASSSAKDMTFYFRPEATVRMPTALVYEGANTNVFDIEGRHHINTLQIRTKDSGCDTYERTQFRVHGSDTVLTINYFAANDNSAHSWQGYRMNFTDGATLAWGQSYGYHTQRAGASFPFVFDHGNFRTTWTGWDKNLWIDALVYATNSTFDTSSMPLDFSGRLLLKDTAWNARRIFLGGPSCQLAMTGGSYTGDLSVGREIGFGNLVYSAGAWQVGFTNAVVTLQNTDATPVFIFGYDGTSAGTCTVVQTTMTAANIRLANAAGSRSALNLESGSIAVSGKLAVGNLGDAEVTVSGGALAANQISTQESGANGTASTIRQTGGEIVTRGSNPALILVNDASAQNSTGTLVLDGGVLRVARLYGGSGSHARNSAKTSLARLYANGGTIVATNAVNPFIECLDVAAIGAKGLTVSSDADVTISASFSNQTDAKGVLTLAGAGVKTLSGTATTVSEIVVDGGAVVFADGAKAASKLVLRNGGKVSFAGDPSSVGLTGLVCGDANGFGILTLNAGQTIAVGGDVVLDKARLDLSGTFAVGTVYVPLTATGTVSDETKTCWSQEALVATGYSSTNEYALSTATAEGVTSFRLSVETPTRSRDLAEGTSTVSDDIAFGANGRLGSDVGAGAALTLGGELSAGALVKTGSGTLYLTNLENLFLHGIESKGGLLSVNGIGALGASADALSGLTLSGGNFEYRGAAEGATYGQSLVIDPGAANVVGLWSHTPLTLTNVAVKSGSVFKAGAGTLTIAPPPGTTTTLAASEGPGGAKGGDPASPYNIGDISNPLLSPTTGLTGFNVVEGEVRIVGDATTQVKIDHTLMVGVTSTGGTAQPVLTVDGAKVSLGGNWTTFQMDAFIGQGCSTAFCRYPRLNITNGADVSTYIYICGRNGANYQTYPTVTVDRSTWTLSSFRPGYSWNGNATHIIRNGSWIKAGDITCYGFSGLHVTDSTISKANGSCLDTEFHGYAGSWWLGSGAQVCVRKIYMVDRDSSYKDLTFNFNGGTWKTATDWQALRMYNPEHVWIRTRTEAGLTLPVDEGRTLYVGHAILGDGGIVKTGAGTLYFESAGEWDNSTQTTKTELADPHTLSFAGPVDVREGTVFVSNGVGRVGGTYRTSAGASVDFDGNSLGAATLAGAGAFANATLAGGTLGLELKDDGTLAGSLSLTDVAFEGRTTVDFGRTAAGDPAAGLVVATFSGTAPDVTKWRARNLGRGARAAFSVSGDKILADITRVGFSLIIK